MRQWVTCTSLICGSSLVISARSGSRLLGFESCHQGLLTVWSLVNYFHSLCLILKICMIRILTSKKAVCKGLTHPCKVLKAVLSKYSFNRQFFEDLLCGKYYSKLQGHLSEKNRQKSCPDDIYILVKCYYAIYI